LVRSFDPILTQDPTVVVSTGGSWNLADDDPFDEVTVVWCGSVVGGCVGVGFLLLFGGARASCIDFFLI
jgi:hypothetical protein